MTWQTSAVPQSSKRRRGRIESNESNRRLEGALHDKISFNICDSIYIKASVLHSREVIECCELIWHSNKNMYHPKVPPIASSNSFLLRKITSFSPRPADLCDLYRSPVPPCSNPENAQMTSYKLQIVCFHRHHHNTGRIYNAVCIILFTRQMDAAS